jgi:hypothetical protein
LRKLNCTRVNFAFSIIFNESYGCDWGDAWKVLQWIVNSSHTLIISTNKQYISYLLAWRSCTTRIAGGLMKAPLWGLKAKSKPKISATEKSYGSISNGVKLARWNGIALFSPPAKPVVYLFLLAAVTLQGHYGT